MTIMRSRSMLVMVILLLLSPFAAAQSHSNLQLSAADLVKAVIHSELNPSGITEVRWKYLLLKEVDGKQETREVVETKLGSLERLIAIAGRPLTASQQRDETERILKLSHDADEQLKLEQTHKKDAEQCDAFLKMVPEAFLFEYAGESGSLTKLVFKPNPAFRPSSREGKVLHEMAGEMWVDAKQQRFLPRRLKLLALAEIGREGDDLAPIGGLQPFEDDGGIEPARIGEHHFFDVAF